MKNDFQNLSLEDIPKESCVIRIKNTNQYLHFDNESLFFYPKMHGCFVLLPFVADDLIQKFEKNDVDTSIIEIINFFDAYNTDGMIENQIINN